MKDLWRCPKCSASGRGAMVHNGRGCPKKRSAKRYPMKLPNPTRRSPQGLATRLRRVRALVDKLIVALGDLKKELE
jgi:hypothetical protein